MNMKKLRLREAVSATGKRLNAIDREIGLPPSTMSRYARTDAYPKTPGRKNKIDDFFAKYEVEIVWNTKDKVCTGCKKLFKTPDNLKKFCTRKCKEAHHARYQRRRFLKNTQREELVDRKFSALEKRILNIEKQKSGLGYEELQILSQITERIKLAEEEIRQIKREIERR